MRALLSTFLSSLPCSLPLQLSLSPSSHRPYVEKSHFTVVSRTVRPSVRPRGCRLSEHHRESEWASEWRACVPASFLPPLLTQPLCLLSSRADQLASPLLSFPLTHESPSSSSYPSRRAAFLWKCARHSPSFPGWILELIRPCIPTCRSETRLLLFINLHLAKSFSHMIVHFKNIGNILLIQTGQQWLLPESKYVPFFLALVGGIRYLIFSKYEIVMYDH